MLINDEFSIARMQLSDLDALLAFLKKTFPDNPRQSDETFWRWHYVDHPNSIPGEIPIWLAKSGDRIAGQVCTIPVELNVGVQTVPSVWILDIMVDPDFRRRGVMKRLVLEVEKDYPHMIATAGVRQHSAAMFTSVGWKVLGRVPRYHKLLYPGNAVRELARIAALKIAANAVFAPFRRLKHVQGVSSSRIEKIERIDSRFDELWNRARPRLGCSISRSSKYLSWQFEQQPYKKFEMLGYFKGESLLGYVVLFFRKPSVGGVIDKAAISDICYLSESGAEIVNALVAAALNLAIERRAGGLVTDAMDSLVENRLKHFGFWPITSELEIMAKAPAGSEVLYDRNAWYLTRGDSDISIFEHPNL